MNAVLASLQPPPRQQVDGDEYEHDPAQWGSMGGFGNLNTAGGVQGMMVPRVPDGGATMQVIWKDIEKDAATARKMR